MHNRRQGSFWFLQHLAALIMSAAGWLAVACSLHATDFYVSPSGRTNGTGSISDPVALSTALIDDTSPARPGDTLWLRGGAYPGGLTSSLKGEANQPITIRQYPGERAAIDGAATNISALTIRGRWNIWRDIGVMDSRTNRTPGEGRPFGVSVESPNTRLINCVVHDNFGIGFWLAAIDAELYGCLAYNVGTEWTNNKGNGHSLDAQNDAGTKWIHDNIFCNSFGLGLNLYTENSHLRGFDLQGNFAFNAGASSASASQTAFLRVVVIP